MFSLTFEKIWRRRWDKPQVQIIIQQHFWSMITKLQMIFSLKMLIMYSTQVKFPICGRTRKKTKSTRNFRRKLTDSASRTNTSSSSQEFETTFPSCCVCPQWASNCERDWECSLPLSLAAPSTGLIPGRMTPFYRSPKSLWAQ